jgi:hypothetical protein
MRGRVLTIIFLVLAVVIIGVVYYRYYFVFGEGTKAGTMNYFVKKGYVCLKPNEGRLIQSGIRSQTQGNISSNEFMFSVTDPKVADKLNHSAGALCLSCIIKNTSTRCHGAG